jgi:hypothetical protein
MIDDIRTTCPFTRTEQNRRELGELDDDDAEMVSVS